MLNDSFLILSKQEEILNFCRMSFYKNGGVAVISQHVSAQMRHHQVISLGNTQMITN
jgi:hypothetical protein